MNELVSRLTFSAHVARKLRDKVGRAFVDLGGETAMEKRWEKKAARLAADKMGYVAYGGV